MAELILAFSSSGGAIAGERKLLDAGVDARIINGPKSTGGAFCLVINSADLNRARLLLGASIRDIYLKDENGKDYTRWTP